MIEDHKFTPEEADAEVLAYIQSRRLILRIIDHKVSGSFGIAYRIDKSRIVFDYQPMEFVDGKFTGKIIKYFNNQVVEPIVEAINRYIAANILPIREQA